ncbi:MAG: protein kinase domain-containing protein [Planctomycetota bacterium]|jgi:tetratricopeptide (TPR) repeat protein
MAELWLYCQQCGRRYRPRAPLDGVELHCGACGGGVARERPSRTGRKEKDPFRGKTIAGAKLRKRLAILPDRMVYRGTHGQLRAEVRVDVFPADFVDRNMAHIRRLFGQATVTGDVRSVHVVTLLDLGRRRDCCYIMTEFLPFGLRSLLQQKGPLAVNRALALVENVLRGLVAINEIGAVHGNVTPEGVLLAYDGSAKLDHLGMALLPEQLNRLVLADDGALVGAAFYIAPERAHDERQAGIGSDLYSLGVTMYEMLSGKRPYEGSSAQEVMLRHASAPVPGVRDVAPEVPEEIARFVARLMAKDPADRPQTSQEALDGLRERAVELSRQKVIKPVIAAITPRERLRSAVKWTAAWTVVCAVLVLLAVFPGVQMCRQRRRARAIKAAVEAPQSRRALIVVREREPLLGEGLPPERSLAMRVLLAHRVAFYPEFEVVDPFYTEKLAAPGRTTEQIRTAANASYALVAEYAPGLQRGHWTLTFVGQEKRPWSLSVECAVEDNDPRGLDAVEAALNQVLGQAARKVAPGRSAGDCPMTGADTLAWSEIGEALLAEREGRWQDALAAADRARQRAPDARPFGLLAAFYAAADRAQATGKFPHGAQRSADGLPPEMAALAAVLDCLGREDGAAIEKRFAEMLARFPRSARGYFLLGLWRLHGQNRTDEAGIAFRHALDMDPGYMPAARSYVELLARRDPGQVAGFLGDLEERTADREGVNRLRGYAQQLLQAGKEAAPAPETK